MKFQADRKFAKCFYFLRNVIKKWKLYLKRLRFWILIKGSRRREKKIYWDENTNSQWSYFFQIPQIPKLLSMIEIIMIIGKYFFRDSKLFTRRWDPLVFSEILKKINFYGMHPFRLSVWNSFVDCILLYIRFRVNFDKPRQN